MSLLYYILHNRLLLGLFSIIFGSLIILNEYFGLFKEYSKFLFINTKYDSILRILDYSFGILIILVGLFILFEWYKDRKKY